MQECLGISVTDKLIRYAKVQKDNKTFKVSSFGVRFYENAELENTIQQIVNETGDGKLPISTEIENEKYYYFNVFNLVNKNYIDKAVKTEFESFCAENRNMNFNTYEGRYIYSKSLENQDQNRVMYVYDNKTELEERYKIFGNERIISATPMPTTLPNIINVEKGKNIMIVNLEDVTTITTILDQNIYNVDVLGLGLAETFERINSKENSFSKTYEVLKNSTIYTMESQFTDTDKNEYLQYIVPALYKIVQEIQNNISKYKSIDKIYLTGYGTVINNVDLYFQEYFSGTKIEILKPFFIQNSGGVSIKDYVEVNSAIALAIQGLGYGAEQLNFKDEDSFKKLKALFTMDIGSVKSAKKNKPKSSKNGFKDMLNNIKNKIGKPNLNLSGKLTKLEIALIRDIIAIFVIIGMFCGASLYLKNQIDIKIDEANETKSYTQDQIALINADEQMMASRATDYDKYKQNLENTASTLEQKRGRKHQITDLLNRIVYSIPSGVQLTGIDNKEISSGGKIIQQIKIDARSKKYEQLAYFKAKLKNANILENVISTEGTKSGDYVEVTITGNLKDY